MKISVGDEVLINSIVNENKYKDTLFPIDPKKRKSLGHVGIVKGYYCDMVVVELQYIKETYFFFEEDLTPMNNE